MELEEVGAAWDRFIVEVAEDPGEFARLSPEERRSILRRLLTPIARFVGATAILFECGEWVASTVRVPLYEGEPEDEYGEEEWTCEVELEDESGCTVTVFALRETQDGDYGVYARDAGEIVEIFLTGSPCDSEGPEWD